jgi:hypothetical protein
MDVENPVVKLCIQSTQAEFAGKLDRAFALCQQAWEASQDDYEACIAAHYLARYQEAPQVRLRWNQEALRRANSAQDGRFQEFFPSLYLCLGQSFELVGDLVTARHYYDLAAGLGVIHLQASDTSNS